MHWVDTSLEKRLSIDESISDCSVFKWEEEDSERVVLPLLDFCSR